jgi:hypothetical protein
MPKYVVTKKCYANEFVFVEAESEEEAIQKAVNNDCISVSPRLEFAGHLDTKEWKTEMISRDNKPENKTTTESSTTTSSETTHISEWDLDYGQQDFS